MPGVVASGGDGSAPGMLPRRGWVGIGNGEVK